MIMWLAFFAFYQDKINIAESVYILKSGGIFNLYPNPCIVRSNSTLFWKNERLSLVHCFF
jgi:hypothetical protein